MRYVFTILCVLFCVSSLTAQNVYREIPVYTDLEYALKHPLQVKKLVLSHQHLHQFPVEILQFKNLILLDLSKNKLNKIPPEITQLKKLEKLNLRKNDLEALPENIGELKNLRYLDLYKNDLIVLPYSIGNLKNLISINLASNPLKILPFTFKEMPNLKVLNVRDTDIIRSELKKLSQEFPNADIQKDNLCDCGPNH